MTKSLLDLVPAGMVALVCDNPHLAFAILSKIYAKPLFCEPKPSNIAQSATIMPNVYIGSNVSVGENTIVMAGAFLGDNVTIGKNCIIHPNVVIYNDCVIGNECHLLANCVIGSDGFGYAHTKTGEHVKIYHNGNVVLGDFVEIGACTTIDRGVFESTMIANRAKIDSFFENVLSQIKFLNFYSSGLNLNQPYSKALKTGSGFSFTLGAFLLKLIRSSVVWILKGRRVRQTLKISAAAMASFRALWWVLFMPRSSFSEPRPYFCEAMVRRLRSMVQSFLFSSMPRPISFRLCEINP